MATSDVLSFSLHQPLWKQSALQGQAERREKGLVIFPLVSEGIMVVTEEIRGQICVLFISTEHL